MNYRERIVTPKSDADIKIVKINNSRFQGTKESFTNLNGNLVDVYKLGNSSVYSYDEYRSSGYDVQIKVGGVYKVPDDSRFKDEGLFILIEKQNSKINGFRDIYLDEYKVRVINGEPNGFLDESIHDASGSEIRDIVRAHHKEFDGCFNVRLHKRRGRKLHVGVTIYSGYPVKDHIVLQGGDIEGRTI